MIKIVVQTFHHDYLKTDEFTEVLNTYDCSDKKGVLSVLLYVRWQFERFGNHSNVNLYYNGVWYYGAI